MSTAIGERPRFFFSFDPKFSYSWVVFDLVCMHMYFLCPKRKREITLVNKYIRIFEIPEHFFKFTNFSEFLNLFEIIEPFLNPWTSSAHGKIRTPKVLYMTMSVTHYVSSFVNQNGLGDTTQSFERKSRAVNNTGRLIYVETVRYRFVTSHYHTHLEFIYRNSLQIYLWNSRGTYWSSDMLRLLNVLLPGRHQVQERMLCCLYLPKKKKKSTEIWNKRPQSPPLPLS